MAMLSDLNLRLQGRDELFANIASDIESFELKLDLLLKDVERGHFNYFEHDKQRKTEAEIDIRRYAKLMQLLKDTMTSRFQEMKTEKVFRFKCMIRGSFITFPHEMQFEIIDLKYNNALTRNRRELIAADCNAIGLLNSGPPSSL